MNGKIFRRAMCVILALTMFGCRSAYDLTLYSKPPGAIVELGPDIQGRTPCNLKIPRKSDIIHNHHIDVKYILDDGREIVKSYDMRNYEPPETGIVEMIGGVIGTCLAAPGMLLIWIAGSGDKDDDKDEYVYDPFDKVDEEQEEEKKENVKAGLLGFGLIVLGVITFNIFGVNDDKKQYEYDILENFEDVNSVPGN